MMEWILSACVLTAAVIGLRYALGGRIDPRLQYALWALVLVRLLIPVNFGWAPFSVGNAVPTLAASTSVPADSAAEGITVPSIQTADPAPAASPEAADPAPAPTVPVSPGEEGQGLPTLSLNQGLTLLWLVGMAAVALWLAGSNLRFARQLRRSRQPVEVAGTRRPAYVTQAVESPCLFGLARPAIYLPPKILEDPEALRYAVAHETTHFRHGDPIWALLRGVCVALHWYNPLVWWGAVLSRRDGESACDEATIRTLGEGERGAYARTLLRLTCGKPSPCFTTATTMAGSPRALRERITRIAQRTRRKAGITVAVLALVAVAAGCTFSAAPPSSAVPIQREFDGEVPEAVAVLTENAIADIAAGYNENGPEGGYVTEAKLTGLTPFPLRSPPAMPGRQSTAWNIASMCGMGPLTCWPAGLPSPLPLAGCGLRNGPVPASPTTLSTEERRTERPPAVGLQNQQRFPWPLTTATSRPGRHLRGPCRHLAWGGSVRPAPQTGFLSHLPSLRKSSRGAGVRPVLPDTADWRIPKTLAEAGSDGAITQAELTALTPVVTQEASTPTASWSTAWVDCLQGRETWPPAGPGHGRRNHRRGHLAHPRNSPSQPYCACWTIRDGEQLGPGSAMPPRRSAVPPRRPGRQLLQAQLMPSLPKCSGPEPPKTTPAAVDGSPPAAGVFFGYSSSSFICRSSRFCPALLARPRAKKARESSAPQARKVTTGTARKWPSSRPVYRSP